METNKVLVFADNEIKTIRSSEWGAMQYASVLTRRENMHLEEAHLEADRKDDDKEKATYKPGIPVSTRGMREEWQSFSFTLEIPLPIH